MERPQESFIDSPDFVKMLCSKWHGASSPVCQEEWKMAEREDRGRLIKQINDQLEKNANNDL